MPGTASRRVRRAHPRHPARRTHLAGQPRPARPVRSRKLVASVAVLVALTLLLAACGGSTAGRVGSTGSGGRGQNLGGQATSTGLTQWDPPDRARLPKLAGRTLDGGRLDVSRWRGLVVVVNTWGSWCGPCREEAPDLRRVAEATRAAGVRFVGIDTRDNDAAARAFVREFAIPYPSIVDDEGRVILALAQTVPVSAVPSTVVVDRKGRIAARVIGAVTYSTLRGLIDDVLAENPPTANDATATPATMTRSAEGVTR